jgi:hypothetical protein
MLDIISVFQSHLQMNIKFFGPNLGNTDLENIGRALEKAQLLNTFEIECADGNKLEYNKTMKYKISFDSLSEEIEDDFF